MILEEANTDSLESISIQCEVKNKTNSILKNQLLQKISLIFNFL